MSPTNQFVNAIYFELYKMFLYKMPLIYFTFQCACIYVYVYQVLVMNRYKCIKSQSFFKGTDIEWYEFAGINLCFFIRNEEQKK